MEESFSRRQIERSFRKFNDIVSDLFNAGYQTWGDGFTHLITHCEKDSVMRAVTDPLRKNLTHDAKTWYLDALNPNHRISRSGPYKLPYDDDDRTALLYQFFLMLEVENVDIVSFCYSCFGTTYHQDSVNRFNQELVLKFTREVSYRLDQIIEDLGDQDIVPREAMFVFHSHTHTHGDTVNISGTIQGSNIALNGSNISGSSATYSSNAEVAEALKGLKSFIQDVAAEHRAAVETALNTLVTASSDQSASPQAVETAAATVAAASPSLKDKLTAVAQKIGLSLLGSSIFQAIKSGVGIH